MARMLDAQTFGSFVVIGCFAAAEAAARFLTAYPSSDFAWYLNIEVFRPFEIARAAASPLNPLFGPYTLVLTIILLMVILLVRVMRLHFAIALMSNLSFVATAALAYAAVSERSGSQHASIGLASASGRPELVLVFVMFVSSLLAFGLSHIAFLRSIRSDLLARPSFER